MHPDSRQAEADTLARARSQLWTIPATLPRADWLRVLMAARSAGIGENEAREWSASAPDLFSERAFLATWRSITPDAGIGPATLTHIAKEHGWTPERLASPPPHRAGWAKKTGPVKREAIREAGAAHALAAMWDRHEAARTADPHHPYLLKKHVLPHFARQDGDDLLIGMFDCQSAEFTGLQTISPDGEKKFAKGTTGKGAFCLIDWPEPLDTRDPSCEQQPVLIAEGWATAATLAECMPWCWCVCAFNAGNLPHIALSLARQYPHRPIVVCGDDDRNPDGTERRDGNIGRMAALQAADHIAAATGRAFEHAYVLPVFSDAGASGDFNDMAHRQGRAAVVDLVSCAIRGCE